MKKEKSEKKLSERWLKESRKKTVGQSVWHSLDCSQIEREEEEEGKNWQKEDQKEEQWEEEKKLEEILECRRMERSFLKVEICKKVPEFVVNGRMAQGVKVTGTKEKKKVKGWSTEEMKDKSNSRLDEDTEEMKEWRGLSQDEMEQLWKKLAGRMQEEVVDKYKVEDSKRGAGLLR